MSPVELPYVSAKELQDYFGTTFYERGRSYANKGMVGQARWDPEDNTLRADVAGSAAQDYTSIVRLKRHSPTAKSFTVLSSQCTCPVGGDCKHVVAALMAASVRQVAPFGSTALHDPDQRSSPTLPAGRLPAAEQLPAVGRRHLGVRSRIGSRSSPVSPPTASMHRCGPLAPAAPWLGLHRRGLRSASRSPNCGALASGTSKCTRSRARS